jgi:hypothetical protein
VDLYQFFAERWDKTGMKELLHVMTWVDGYIDIANSTPIAKQWCRSKLWGSWMLNLRPGANNLSTHPCTMDNGFLHYDPTKPAIAS